MMGCISSANNQPGTGHALFVCCVQTTCAMCRASTNLNKRRFRATYSSNGWARGRRSNDPGSGPPILQPRLRREVKTVKSRVRDRRPSGTEKRLRESAKVLVGIRCRVQRLVRAKGLLTLAPSRRPSHGLRRRPHRPDAAGRAWLALPPPRRAPSAEATARRPRP